MLQENLVYTALTRARELAVVVGSTKALAIAVRQAQSGERVTQLEKRLASRVNSEQ